MVRTRCRKKSSTPPLIQLSLIYSTNVIKLILKLYNIHYYLLCFATDTFPVPVKIVLGAKSLGNVVLQFEEGGLLLSCTFQDLQPSIKIKNIYISIYNCVLSRNYKRCVLMSSIFVYLFYYVERSEAAINKDILQMICKEIKTCHR